MGRAPLGGLVTCRDQYDVAVIGAGAAGIAAALGASRARFRGSLLSVALIESSQRLGGAVTAAMHRSLCGLYADRPTGPLDTLNDGAQREVVARMVRLSPDCVLPRQMGAAWVLEFPPQVWESALDGLSSLPNVDRLMGCKVCEVQRKSGMISGVCIDGALNHQLEVRVLIDCTGGGVAIQMAGDDIALPSPGESRMLGGYSARLAGLGGDLEMLRVQIPYELVRAVLDGKLPVEARFTMFHPGPGAGEGICKLAVSPDRFAQEEVELFASQVLEHLKAQLPAFKEARVVECSSRALPRDGIRLRGRYTVTEDDVLSARKHGDGSVHGWWPIEYWDNRTGPNYTFPPIGQHYDIPSDALQSAVIPNLLAAGTCVSATSRAAASLRASGICLATGYAAGQLAASVLTDLQE